MDGCSFVRYLLVSSADLIAIVPNKRIMAGVLPINSQLPAILLRQISGVKDTTLSDAENFYIQSDRIQVNVYSKNYKQTKDIADLVIKVNKLQSTVVNGTLCNGVYISSSGTDMYDQELDAHIQIIDFIVKYNRSSV